MCQADLFLLSENCSGRQQTANRKENGGEDRQGQRLLLQYGRGCVVEWTMVRKNNTQKNHHVRKMLHRNDQLQRP